MLEDLIKITPIISSQRILTIDSVLNVKTDLKCEYIHCSPNELKKLTKYPIEYMNSFDIVFCPKFLYLEKIKNRLDILKILVWLMSRKSILTFSVPVLNFYKPKIQEKDDYYKYENEFWYKPLVDGSFNLFKTWNLENPNAKFDLEVIKIIRREQYIIYSMELTKKI